MNSYADGPPDGSWILGLCRRCRQRYATTPFCAHCLHAAQSNIAEKRSILLADLGTGDALSASF